MSDDSDFEGWVKREVDELRRTRDELRVKAHLGRAELRDRWEALERSLSTRVSVCSGSRRRRSCRSAWPRIRASPQSITYTWPWRPTITFLGLRSRWITSLSCAYAIASHTLSITPTTRGRFQPASPR